ncbi:MAG: hypothetical protein KF906_12995 [Actinobacteria bacterium]|nr:hypothetical protein [Actinomycetota bacterium]
MNDVHIAKIARSQAIIVALITTLGGSVAGFFLGGGLQGKSSIEQQWLVIEGIEGDVKTPIRVVANVNGISYSYPSKAVWTEIGPTMAKESFPLPAGEEKYNVSFSILYKPLAIDPTKDLIRGPGQNNDIVKHLRSQLPTQPNGYDIYPVENGLRGAKPELKVIYHIE